MHGDFTRDTYDPTRQFTRVLHQQGRLVVDADANEQSAILLGYLRQLGADLIGWHGGVGVGKDTHGKPESGAFVVSATAADKVSVTGGAYYVDGIRVDDKPTAEPISRTGKDEDKAQLVYLDVWERHVTGWEEPSLLDVALGGLDTTTRVKLEVAVNVLRVPEAGVKYFTDLNTPDASQDKLRSPSPLILINQADETTAVTVGALNARPLDAPIDMLPKLAAWTVAGRDPALAAPGVTVAAPVEDDCDGVSRGGFVGLENQLYRVEVHAGGKPPGNSDVQSPVTVKWSHDNGSMVYPFKDLGVSGDICTLTLTAGWRDDARAIRKDDWVEVLAAPADSGILLQVQAEDRAPNGRKLTLSKKHLSPAGNDALAKLVNAKLNPGLLRRWDHRTAEKKDPKDKLDVMLDGGIVVQFDWKNDTTLYSKPILLEDGLLVRLAMPIADAEFRPGDYWLIPARAATGDVLWKLDADGKAAWEKPRYTEHHYAPLAIINADGTTVTDLRRAINQK